MKFAHLSIIFVVVAAVGTAIATWVLGACKHKHYTFPRTPVGNKSLSVNAAATTGTYVVCLDCGKEFPYDWIQMKMIKEIPT